MYGAIIGDIVGSCYEFIDVKSADFLLFSEGSCCTDDSVMTVAVASALLRHRKEGIPLAEATVQQMQHFGQMYPDAGYGGRFFRWLYAKHPRPYGSYGNGSAMRVSPCGLIAGSLKEALELAEITASVTHDHPEGIRGAQATAGAVYLARTGASREEIRRFVTENYYPLDRTLDEIRPDYYFDVSCQGSVPEAITAFLESYSYEDTVRLAVSLGGDSDTQAAIAGAIAWSFYGREGLMPDQWEMLEEAMPRIPGPMLDVIAEFEEYRKGL